MEHMVQKIKKCNFALRTKNNVNNYLTIYIQGWEETSLSWLARSKEHLLLVLEVEIITNTERFSIQQFHVVNDQIIKYLDQKDLDDFNAFLKEELIETIDLIKVNHLEQAVKFVLVHDKVAFDNLCKEIYVECIGKTMFAYKYTNKNNSKIEGIVVSIWKNIPKLISIFHIDFCQQVLN